LLDWHRISFLRKSQQPMAALAVMLLAPLQSPI
jgi:hypothetical protein